MMAKWQPDESDTVPKFSCCVATSPTRANGVCQYRLRSPSGGSTGLTSRANFSRDRALVIWPIKGNN